MEAPMESSKWPKIGKRLMHNEFLIALSVSACTILLGVFLGWYNNKVVPVNPDSLARYTQEAHNRLSFMANWDGVIYLRIAHQGYKSVDDTGFFPLYPLAIRAVDFVVSSPLYSALLVAWSSLVGAVYFYIKILKKLFDIKDNLEAARGVLFFVLFPPAVILLATYTESLFALLALGAIYFALQKKYLPAALFTMLTTATRIDGLFVLVLVALILLEQKEKLDRIILGAIVGSLGLVSYMVFLLINYHNPIEFVLAQRNNGWLHAGYLSHLASTFNILNVPIIILLVATVIYWWQRRKSFSIYSFLFLCIPILGGQFEGFNRYAIMAFPAQFMMYGWLRNKKLGYAIAIALFGVFWGYLLLQYAGGYTGT